MEAPPDMIYPLFQKRYIVLLKEKYLF